MATSPYRQDLHRLGQQLLDLAEADPVEVIAVLGALLDQSSPTYLGSALRSVRQRAAVVALQAAGTQQALADQVGVSLQAMNRALHPPRRHDDSR